MESSPFMHTRYNVQLIYLGWQMLVGSLDHVISRFHLVPTFGVQLFTSPVRSVTSCRRCDCNMCSHLHCIGRYQYVVLNVSLIN